MFRTLVASLFVLMLAVAGQATARDVSLEQMYGAGVHAYFARDYQQAAARIAAAIDGGYHDARAYYFRGLANSQLGRSAEAAADFRMAAALESADPAMERQVSLSLQRVQGNARVTIEAYRAQGRYEAAQVQRARDEQLYTKRQTQQERVVGAVALEPVPAAAPDDLFAGNAARADAPPLAAPGRGAVEDDPFATEDDAFADAPPLASGRTAPSVAPADDDPFGAFDEPDPADNPPADAPAFDFTDPAADASVDNGEASTSLGELRRGLMGILGRALTGDPDGAAPQLPGFPFGDEAFPDEEMPEDGDVPTIRPNPFEFPEEEAMPADDDAPVDPFGDAFGADEPAAAGDAAGADDAPAIDPFADPFGADEPAGGNDPFGADDAGADEDSNGSDALDDPFGDE